MSIRNPVVPPELKDEFMGYMAAHDHDDLADGAWFQCLEDAAQEFLNNHGIGGQCANSAAHLYLSWSVK